MSAGRWRFPAPPQPVLAPPEPESHGTPSRLVVQAGGGSPTLVLESGGGEDAAQWSGILPELARQTRVLAYSRAGSGRSAPSRRAGSPQSSVPDSSSQDAEPAPLTGPDVRPTSWRATQRAVPHDATVKDRG